MSKVIQIAVEPGTESVPTFLFALCEDGTIWRLLDGGDYSHREWVSIPSPPSAPIKLPEFSEI